MLIASAPRLKARKMLTIRHLMALTRGADRLLLLLMAGMPCFASSHAAVQIAIEGALLSGGVADAPPLTKPHQQAGEFAFTFAP